MLAGEAFGTFLFQEVKACKMKNPSVLEGCIIKMKNLSLCSLSFSIGYHLFDFVIKYNERGQR